MPLFTEANVRARAKKGVPMHFSAATVLTEQMERQNAVTAHDVFLSHAYEDREMVLGTALLIQDFGYSVYLDWRDDPKLDREQVTPETALKLRERMRASKCLFYSVTPNAGDSAWTKWELGFKDGHNKRAAILPIVNVETDNYGGQQFLGIYPYVSNSYDRLGKKRLWIRRSLTCYVAFDAWLDGTEPAEHQ